MRAACMRPLHEHCDFAVVGLASSYAGYYQGEHTVGTGRDLPLQTFYTVP